MIKKLDFGKGYNMPFIYIGIAFLAAAALEAMLFNQNNSLRGWLGGIGMACIVIGGVSVGG